MIKVSVTPTGSAIEYGNQTIAMSRYSETHANLLSDYGIGTHNLNVSDIPPYLMMWVSPDK